MIKIYRTGPDTGILVKRTQILDNVEYVHNQRIKEEGHAGSAFPLNPSLSNDKIPFWPKFWVSGRCPYRHIQGSLNYYMKSSVLLNTKRPLMALV